MAGYADNLARLRALCGADVPLPPDLASWVVNVAEANAPAAVLRRRRDELLRQAAAMLNGSDDARAARLVAELARIERAWPAPIGRPCDDEPIRRILIEARSVGRMPGSRRQLLRVLQGSSQR